MERYVSDRSHSGVGYTWALVLAAGEGSRLSSLTTVRPGVTVPKQFCSLCGGMSLVEEAIERAATVAAPEHICAVVSSHHRHWWEAPLASLPRANVIEQPLNRGTANGILFPLLHIVERDPAARVVILPSDHHFRSERTLRRSLLAGLEAVQRDAHGIVLLGLDPEEADPELGYIVPGRTGASQLAEVSQFVEKPPLRQAAALIARGGLWNVFILAARAGALLSVFERRCPEVVMEMRALVKRGLRAPHDLAAAAELYARLPELDFSRHVAQLEASALRVLRVPQCGWSDLGTPKRIAEVLRHPAAVREAVGSRPLFGAHLSLAEQHARMAGAS